jgi:hypothetical protein
MKPLMKNMVDDKKWISISSGSLSPGISRQPEFDLVYFYYTKKYILAQTNKLCSHRCSAYFLLF